MDAASLNKMLEAAVMDMGARKPALSRDEHRSRAFADRASLEKSLGLHPQPSRTPLNLQSTGTLQRDGYRIEKLAFESRPGVTVTAHLYLPDGEGPFPLVLSTVEDGPQKKAAPWVQARGIGLALYGFAALIVDSPGGVDNERSGMGDPDDAWLALGAPAVGHYVWDLMRALDACQGRSDISAEKVAITGGEAAAFAFAMDDRMKAAAIVGWGSSLEVMAASDSAPGVAVIGDRCDVLGIRAPAPVMLIGAAADPYSPPDGDAKTTEKLRTIYEMFDLPDRVRLQVIDTARDYNRRMREGMYAFFLQHLTDKPALSYAPELRPMTDGAMNPFERGTEPADDPELRVLEQAPDGLTFRQELDRALAEPNPEPFKADKLIPWGKHGRIENLEPGDVLLIHDEDHRPEPAGSKRLPMSGINHEMCFSLNLSVAEFLAEVLHYRLPGRPEGWESQGITGDAFTSMIASVKTIVEGVNPPPHIRRLEAVGPVASEVARQLKLLRPSLEIRVSHPWQSWKEQMDSGMLQLAMPLARYKRFS